MDLFLLSFATRAGSPQQHVSIILAPEKNPRSTGEIDKGNSTHMKCHTGLRVSGESTDMNKPGSRIAVISVIKF